MNVAKIAVRNIVRQKKRSILLGGAIAFGVMIITLINSFTRGVTDTASANFTDLLGGQIYITGKELTPTGGNVSVIRERELLDQALANVKAPITAKTYRSRTIGEVIFGSKRTITTIEGADWHNEPELIESLDILDGEVSADLPDNSLIIPEYTAEEIGVQVGETVLIRTSTVTGQQNVVEFTVRGITEGDSMFSFSSAHAKKSYLNSLIGLGQEDYQILNVSLRNPVLAEPATRAITSFLRSNDKMAPETGEEGGIAGMRSRMMGMASLMGGGALFTEKVAEEERWKGTRFEVLNLSDMMEGVTSMVSVLNTVSYVIFVILLVITMVGLLNTFRMVLIERTREIGTMRAIGMQRTEVRNIFLTEALFLSVGGALAGVVLAILLSGILGIVPFSSDSPLQFLLVDGTFSFPIVPLNIISTLIIITIATLFAAYLPARRAAKLDPAVALRTTY